MCKPSERANQARVSNLSATNIHVHRAGFLCVYAHRECVICLFKTFLLPQHTHNRIGIFAAKHTTHNTLYLIENVERI